MNDLPADAQAFISHLIRKGNRQLFNGRRQRLKNNFHGVTYTPDEQWQIAAVKSGYNQWTALEPLPKIPVEAEEELTESPEERKRRTRNLVRLRKTKRSSVSIHLD